MKILVMGGCHVDGYLVGEDRSFPAVLSGILFNENISHELKIVPYFIAKDAQAFQKIAEDMIPDVLILQIGNYEFLPVFYKGIKKKLGIKTITPKTQKAKSYKIKTLDMKNKIDKGLLIDDMKFFKETVNFKIKMAIKNMIITVFRYPFFNEDKVVEDINRLFIQIKSLKIAKVIILSPLPCADTGVMRYRGLGAQLVKQKTHEYGFDYVNMLDDLLTPYQDAATTVDIFIDENHLNIKGHLVVGTILGENLAKQAKKTQYPKLALVK